MKFVFLGSGEIAWRCLDRYLERFRETVCLVGISAPRETIERLHQCWRGQNFPKVIELSASDRQETELIHLLESTCPQFVISVQYPWILSGKVLAAANQRVLNLHNAKLPEYRGHNTISHEILNGEKEHVSTLHWMAKEVDRGMLVNTASVAIEPDDTAYSLWKRTAETSVELFSDCMAQCQEFVPEKAGVPVPPGGRYYPKNAIGRLKEIPQGASVVDIDRIARAFWFPPHEPAYFNYEGRKLYVMPNIFSYGATHLKS